MDFDELAHELYPQICASVVPISDACNILAKAIRDAYEQGKRDERGPARHMGTSSPTCRNPRFTMKIGEDDAARDSLIFGTDGASSPRQSSKGEPDVVSR